jgi:hypothetical protein
MAEQNALANLVAFFGQSVQASTEASTAYYEAIKSGVTTDWTQNQSVQSSVRSSASMDNLIGAEIRGRYNDALNKTWYAIAVMDKARTIQVYSELIRANHEMITNLTTMSQEEKNSLDGYSRYQFAAIVAEMNTVYNNLLKVIGSSSPVELVSANTYRVEAQNITKQIPILVRVKNDKAGRIKSAFEKAIIGMGFRSGGNNSRYVCEVDISMSPVDLPNPNNNKFVRIELTADLTDTSNETILMTWNFNQREGHVNLSEAEDRAMRFAENKVNTEYKGYLNTHLGQLIPKK